MKVKINDITDVVAGELKAQLKAKFLLAKVGDIIKVQQTNKTEFNYLVLCKGDGSGYRDRTYSVVNLNTGYLWRAGGEDLTDSFTEWFTHNDSLTITELDVVDSSELTITSFK